MKEIVIQIRGQIEDDVSTEEIENAIHDNLPMDEWANEMYPCDGQAQLYLIEGAKFGYNKAKNKAKGCR
jgi:hypothetical protein